MSQPLNLLDLPVDILSLILAQLLTAPNNGIISLCPCKANRVTINPIPIFLIHPSIYAIAHPLFYGPSNTFLLDLIGSHASHTRRFIDSAADDALDEAQRSGDNRLQQLACRQLLLRRTGGSFLLLSQGARRKVRRFELRIQRLRGWLWDDLGPLLRDMAVRGELADLTLLVDESSSGRNGANGDRAQSIARAFMCDRRRFFDRPPLEGLVRLLADPGIRDTRLRVKGRHQRAWCAFHVGIECGLLSFLKQRVGYGKSRDGDALKKEDEQVIDIDWRAILSMVDPEGRRRAVAWQE